MEDSLRILVGTKKDSEEREVSNEQAREFAQNNGLAYFETSAKDNENIDDLFYYAIDKCKQKFQTTAEDENKDIVELKYTKKERKCG